METNTPGAGGRADPGIGQNPGRPDTGTRGTSGEAFGASCPPGTPNVATDQRQSAGGRLSDRASQWAEQARGSGREAVSKTKESLREGAESLRQQAAATREDLTERGRSMIDDRKAWAADEIQHVCSALRQAAETLRDEEDDRVAGYADAAADRVDRAASYLRERRVEQIVDDVSQLARRRPELFLGGMFLAGLAVARFIKAATPQPDPIEAPYAPDYTEWSGAMPTASSGGIGKPLLWPPPEQEDVEGDLGVDYTELYAGEAGTSTAAPGGLGHVPDTFDTVEEGRGEPRAEQFGEPPLDEFDDLSDDTSQEDRHA